MYQYRVKQRNEPIAANDNFRCASTMAFDPVDDILDHCDRMSLELAREIRVERRCLATLPYTT